MNPEDFGFSRLAGVTRSEARALSLDAEDQARLAGFGVSREMMGELGPYYMRPAELDGNVPWLSQLPGGFFVSPAYDIKDTAVFLIETHKVDLEKLISKYGLTYKREFRYALSYLKENMTGRHKLANTRAYFLLAFTKDGNLILQAINTSEKNYIAMNEAVGGSDRGMARIRHEIGTRLGGLFSYGDLVGRDDDFHPWYIDETIWPRLDLARNTAASWFRGELSPWQTSMIGRYANLLAASMKEKGMADSAVLESVSQEITSRVRRVPAAFGGSLSQYLRAISNDAMDRGNSDRDVGPLLVEVGWRFLKQLPAYIYKALTFPGLMVFRWMHPDTLLIDDFASPGDLEVLMGATILPAVLKKHGLSFKTWMTSDIKVFEVPGERILNSLQRNYRNMPGRSEIRVSTAEENVARRHPLKGKAEQLWGSMTLGDKARFETYSNGDASVWVRNHLDSAGTEKEVRRIAGDLRLQAWRVKDVTRLKAAAEELGFGNVEVLGFGGSKAAFRTTVGQVVRLSWSTNDPTVKPRVRLDGTSYVSPEVELSSSVTDLRVGVRYLPLTNAAGDRGAEVADAYELLRDIRNSKPDEKTLAVLSELQKSYNANEVLKNTESGSGFMSSDGTYVSSAAGNNIGLVSVDGKVYAVAFDYGSSTDEENSAKKFQDAFLKTSPYGVEESLFLGTEMEGLLKRIPSYTREGVFQSFSAKQATRAEVREVTPSSEKPFGAGVWTTIQYQFSRWVKRAPILAAAGIVFPAVMVAAIYMYARMPSISNNIWVELYTLGAAGLLITVPLTWSLGLVIEKNVFPSGLPMGRYVSMERNGPVISLHVMHNIDELRQSKKAYQLVLNDVFTVAGELLAMIDRNDPRVRGVRSLRAESHLLANQRTGKPNRLFQKAMEGLDASITVRNMLPNIVAIAAAKYIHGANISWGHPMSGKLVIDLSDTGKIENLRRWVQENTTIGSTEVSQDLGQESSRSEVRVELAKTLGTMRPFARNERFAGTTVRIYPEQKNGVYEWVVKASDTNIFHFLLRVNSIGELVSDYQRFVLDGSNGNEVAQGGIHAAENSIAFGNIRLLNGKHDQSMDTIHFSVRFGQNDRGVFVEIEVDSKEKGVEGRWEGASEAAAVKAPEASEKKQTPAPDGVTVETVGTVQPNEQEVHTEINFFEPEQNTLVGVKRSFEPIKIDVPAFQIKNGIVVRNSGYHNPSLEGSIEVEVAPGKFEQAEAFDEVARALAKVIGGMTDEAIALLSQKENGWVFGDDAVSDWITHVVHVINERNYDKRRMGLRSFIQQYLKDILAYLKASPSEQAGMVPELAKNYRYFSRAKILKDKPYNKFSVLHKTDYKKLRLAPEGDPRTRSPNVMAVEPTVYQFEKGRRFKDGQIPPEKLAFAKWKGRTFLFYTSRTHSVAGVTQRMWRYTESYWIVPQQGGWLVKHMNEPFPENVDDVPAELGRMLDDIVDSPEITIVQSSDSFRKRANELGLLNFGLIDSGWNDLARIFAARSPEEVKRVVGEMSGAGIMDKLSGKNMNPQVLQARDYMLNLFRRGDQEEEAPTADYEKPETQTQDTTIRSEVRSNGKIQTVEMETGRTYALMSDEKGVWSKWEVSGDAWPKDINDIKPGRTGMINLGTPNGRAIGFELNFSTAL
ncbi:MAG: hypothetical protein WCJ71_04320, partial [Candidatus Omnitrophota bacterium]